MSKKVYELNTYADEKIAKELGELVIEEMNSLTEAELKSQVVASLESMSDAAEELSQNPKYQEVKRDLDYVTQGKKAVDKYQKAKITYARKRLRDMGKVPTEDLQLLTIALRESKQAVAEKKAKLAAAKDYVASCPECNGRVDAATGACFRCVTMHEQDRGRYETQQANRDNLRDAAEQKAVDEIRAEKEAQDSIDDGDEE